MLTIPTITPLMNLEESRLILKDLLVYKKNNWAVGQLYPAGGPDKFSYFFAIRNLPIKNYLRGTISIGEPTAYDINIATLIAYTNQCVEAEVDLINEQIALLLDYQSKNWAVGELYPDSGIDGFVTFFAQRHLYIYPYLRGTVSIGEPTAYCNNINLLSYYRDQIASYLILTK